ncbi:MAG: Smr protein/MutS2 [Alphaproteobacteria bacterium]|jgi:DNA-nicking Smr family endonuclease|nr:Smr protein/MutS2 [Alphaproteobacteria bacterium]
MTRKKRSLTDEEQALWNLIAEKIKPLESEKKHGVQAPSKVHHSPSRPKAISQKAPLLLSLEGQPTSSSSTHRVKRIRKIEIQARLDLHGLTLDQARLRLPQFLISCQEKRYLWVLIITGKGQRNLALEEFYETRRQKTLRELVPQWLEESALRSIVSAYATAKPQDGGSGALYVRLKRLR